MIEPLIIGNWKLNGNQLILQKFIKTLNKELKDIKNCQIAIAPPMLYLAQAKQLISNHKIKLCAQNVDIHLHGAFTGETSAQMLKDIGVEYVIIGHSERRIHHRENDQYISKKYAIAKLFNLMPIICIGETEKEHNQGKTEEICKYQIDAILDSQGIIAFENSIIAYEPIWAIGTNHSADPKQVQDIHEFIRYYLAKKSKVISEQVIIQYGGSVNEKNANLLLDQQDINGLLIGTHSLNEKKFMQIIKAAIAKNI
ncbi:MAG: triose-phosphate isomerase [Pantoea sp. Brub]|nr:triose-phosphate isomerase [Pantoea sp. Brub]